MRFRNLWFWTSLYLVGMLDPYRIFQPSRAQPNKHDAPISEREGAGLLNPELSNTGESMTLNELKLIAVEYK